MGKNNYQASLKAIKDETGCSHKEAMKLYRQRKDAEKTAKKNEDAESVGVEKPTDSIVVNNDASKIKRCEKFILGHALTTSQMHRYLRQNLGDSVTHHMHTANKKQIFFLFNGTRIPAEGYFRVTI